MSDEWWRRKKGRRRPFWFDISKDLERIEEMMEEMTRQAFNRPVEDMRRRVAGAG